MQMALLEHLLQVKLFMCRMVIQVLIARLLTSRRILRPQIKQIVFLRSLYLTPVRAN